MSTNQHTHDLDRAHVFHSWSAQGSLDPLVIAGGKGTEVWDFDGRRYLDFSSQLVNTNIGHAHPKVVEAIREQALVLSTVAPAHANLARGEAARRILAKAGPEFAASAALPRDPQSSYRSSTLRRVWQTCELEVRSPADAP